MTINPQLFNVLKTKKLNLSYRCNKKYTNEVKNKAMNPLSIIWFTVHKTPK